MTDIIERVSRVMEPDVWLAIDRGAVREDQIPEAKERLYAKAREVVLAVLRSVREPSEGMRSAGRETIDDYYAGDCLRYDEIGRVYQAMLSSLIQELET